MEARLRRVADLLPQLAGGRGPAPAGTGQKAGAKMKDPAVVVTGPAQELLLFAFGRQDHARVALDGDAAAVEKLMGARLGM